MIRALSSSPPLLHSRPPKRRAPRTPPLLVPPARANPAPGPGLGPPVHSLDAPLRALQEAASVPRPVPMAESSGGERRTAKYGELDMGRVRTAKTVDAFLEVLNLSNLSETFRRANVTSVDHLMHLVPGDLDEMGIRLAGVRVRLQKGLCLLREQQPAPASSAPAAGGVRREGADASSVRGGKSRPRPAVPRALRVESTRSRPSPSVRPQMCARPRALTAQARVARASQGRRHHVAPRRPEQRDGRDGQVQLDLLLVH